jgi:hypothetical protein
LARVKFKALNPAAGALEIRIGDGPAALGLADVNAEVLPVRAVNGMLKMHLASLANQRLAASTRQRAFRSPISEHK